MPGWIRAHGTTDLARAQLNPVKGKIEGGSYIQKFPLTVQLWKRHLAGKYGLGIFPLRDDGMCCWGAIDIDVYDIKHNVLERRIKELKLPLIVARTKSGGAHLYLFMTNNVPALLMRGKLMEWAVALGYSGVEVFPKQIALASERDYGNWLNMPYYNGAETMRYAIRNGKAIADPALFLDYAESCKITAEELNAIDVTEDDAFQDGPPCLQTLALRGFPVGSRNDGLFNCALYMRRRHKDKARLKLGAANSAFMKPPLEQREVDTIFKSSGTKGYFYRCGEEPIKSVCNRQLCITRKYGIGGGTEALNVSINGVIKLLTQPVTWIVDVNGTRIEVSTDTLLNQRAFRVCVAEALTRVPNMLKPGAWDKLIDAKIQMAEIQQAPVTASSEGELLMHLEDFCTDANAMEKEELLNGLPWDDAEGKFTYFRSSDFRVYLETKRVRGWTNNKLWAALKRSGAKHITMKVKGKKMQVWGVPSFDQQDEDFSVPIAHEEGDF